MRLRRKPSDQKPRLLILNQYYWPGVEATANLLHDLATDLAEDFEVTVLTGMLQFEGVHTGESIVDGVRVVRVRSASYDRRRLFQRGINYLTYLFHALRVGWRMPRPDLIFCMTDPPMAADIGVVLARRFRAPLVVTSQDVFPEVAVEVGRLDNPLLIGVLRKLVAFYLVRADRVVAIGETMRDRLAEKGAPPERIRVIANWVETSVLVPQPRDNEWARANDLADGFVVMHSGNVGHAQNLDALVRAGSFMRDLDDLVIAVIGSGARHADLVALAELLEVDALRFLPYQDRALLPMSLSSADLHVVGLAKGLSGYVVPSRLYGIMSVARPVLVAAEATSETAQLVEKVGCGIVVEPGRPELLAEQIRRAHAGELDLEGMGQRAREYVIAEADRKIAVDRYRRVFEEVLSK
jgi:colanic acid biosynthesis glycosyl transferase WcaI